MRQCVRRFSGQPCYAECLPDVGIGAPCRAPVGDNRAAVDLLRRIFYAHVPGSVSGEAILCPAFADEARRILSTSGETLP